MKIKSLAVCFVLLAGAFGCKLVDNPYEEFGEEFGEPVCEPQCDTGWDCVSERCVEVIATEQDEPISIVADGDYLYWINLGTFDTWDNYGSDGTVSRSRKDGSQPQILASDLYYPGQFILDDTHAYWIEGHYQSSINRVMRVPKDGSGPSELVFENEDETHTSALALSETDIYLTTRPDNYGATLTVDFWQIPKDLSTTGTIIYQEPTEVDSLEVSNDHLYWYVFASEKDQHVLKQVPLDGPYEPVELHLVGDATQELTITSSDLYWWMDTVVRTAPLDEPGADSKTLGQADGDNPSKLLVDSDSLYWSITVALTDGNWRYVIHKAPLDPGPGTIVMEGLSCTGHERPFALDEQFIYAINGTDIIRFEE